MKLIKNEAITIIQPQPPSGASGSKVEDDIVEDESSKINKNIKKQYK